MPICEKFYNQWSWKQTMKKTMTFTAAMTCPYCNETQFQTRKSNTKGSILTGIIFLILSFIHNIFNLPVAGLFSLFLIFLVMIIVLYPFIVDLSSKKEKIKLFGDKR